MKRDITRKLSRAGWVATLFFCLMHSSGAQEAKTRSLVQASLLAGTRNPSAPFDVGIRLRIARGWHLYWRNPGDAGLPIDVAWKLPAGFRSAGIRYPAPKKKLVDDAICYVYEGEVVLLCRIEPLAMHPQRDSAVLSARLDWLVCKERCLRGGTDIALDLSALSDLDADRNSRAIHAAERKLPPLLESEGTRIERANIRNSGTKKLIELEFAGTGSQGLQDFYPEALEECTIHYGEITVTRNIVRIPVTPSGPHVRFDRITGLAVIGGKAYEAAARIRGDSR